MKERPILFSAPMVLAILAGKKTQTRRLVMHDGAPARGAFWDHGGWAPRVERGAVRWYGDGPEPFGAGSPEVKGYAEPGDRLWVRETFGGDDLCGYAYRADHPDWTHFQGDGEQPDGPWRPSIFMPRAASRLTLAVESVHVERLQAITDADARAEGVEMLGKVTDARGAFAALWESINGERAPWTSNPWVWVIAFSRVST